MRVLAVGLGQIDDVPAMVGVGASGLGSKGSLARKYPLTARRVAKEVWGRQQPVLCLVTGRSLR